LYGQQNTNVVLSDLKKENLFNISIKKSTLFHTLPDSVMNITVSIRPFSSLNLVPRKQDNFIPGINFSYPIKKIILRIDLVSENIAFILR